MNWFRTNKQLRRDVAAKQETISRLRCEAWRLTFTLANRTRERNLASREAANFRETLAETQADLFMYRSGFNRAELHHFTWAMFLHQGVFGTDPLPVVDAWNGEGEIELFAHIAETIPMLFKALDSQIPTDEPGCIEYELISERLGPKLRDLILSHGYIPAREEYVNTIVNSWYAARRLPA